MLTTFSTPMMPIIVLEGPRTASLARKDQRVLKDLRGPRGPRDLKEPSAGRSQCVVVSTNLFFVRVFLGVL